MAAPTKGAKMAKKKVVLRRWTKDDLRLLKSMVKDKKGIKKIAKALKRTVYATRAMAVKRGVSLSTKVGIGPFRSLRYPSRSSKNKIE
jgi:hypothetical protein